MQQTSFTRKLDHAGYTPFYTRRGQDYYDFFALI